MSIGIDCMRQKCERCVCYVPQKKYWQPHIKANETWAAEYFNIQANCITRLNKQKGIHTNSTDWVCEHLFRIFSGCFQTCFLVALNFHAKGKTNQYVILWCALCIYTEYSHSWDNHLKEYSASFLLCNLVSSICILKFYSMANDAQFIFIAIIIRELQWLSNVSF